MSATNQSLLPAAIAILKDAGVDDATGDARRLLAFAMECAPERLTLHLSEELSSVTADRYSKAITRRAARQPLSHITGKRLFWTHEFTVSSDVLDPRPETECLVELALQQPFSSVLDLGTGSGCILLSLLSERQTATGVGVDNSAAALEIARDNAGRLDLSSRVKLQKSSWFDTVEGRFDLIVSNPPYITDAEMAELSPEVQNHEPHEALTPGGDGLSAYRIISSQARRFLKPGGSLMFEIGPAQGADVLAILTQNGFEGATIHPDLDGRDRVVLAQNSA